MISVALVATWLAAGAGQVAAGLGGFAGASLPSSSAFTLGPRREAGDSASPVYRPEERAVSTWRADTARALEPKLLAMAAALTGLERPVVTRCVKLNNPWCIKRARWTGEIGADDEGHVAFATIDNGADAAAALLRTYYVDYGRVSALDIVRRWAPAECRIGSPDGSALVLSVRGLGLTLRARFLAAQGGRRAAGSAAVPAPASTAGGRAAPASKRVASPQRVRVSVIPSIRLPSYRVPDIAAGMGERPSPSRAAPPIARPRPAVIRVGAPRRIPAPARLVSAPRRDARAVALAPRPAAASAISAARGIAESPGPTRPAALSPRPAGPAPSAPGSGCGDETRIRNYANRIGESVALGPGDDLKLFGPGGRPRERLAPVLVAMSSVELGLLRAGTALVEAAVARATATADARIGGMLDGPSP